MKRECFSVTLPLKYGSLSKCNFAIREYCTKAVTKKHNATHIPQIH